MITPSAAHRFIPYFCFTNNQDQEDAAPDSRVAAGLTADGAERRAHPAEFYDGEGDNDRRGSASAAAPSRRPSIMMGSGGERTADEDGLSAAVKEEMSADVTAMDAQELPSGAAEDSMEVVSEEEVSSHQ